MGIIVISIESSTIASNVPVSTGLDADPAQFSHGFNKGLIEGLGVAGPRVHCGPGPAVGEQNLVRREQAHSLLEVSEVYVVKGSGRDGVHVDRHSRVHVPRAHLL